MFIPFLPPTSDRIRHGTKPIVTGTLIGINVFVFGIQMLAGGALNFGYCLIPVEISEGRDRIDPYTDVAPCVRDIEREFFFGPEWNRMRQHRGPVPIYLTLLTCTFLHSGAMHLLLCVWALGVFADDVEDALGHGLFLAFYFLCGAVASICHVLSVPGSSIPFVGASGAVFGVLGAYLWICPFNRLQFKDPKWDWTTFGGSMEVPAFVVIGFWFLLYYLIAFMVPAINENVAAWAHLGGFLCGLFAVASLACTLACWQRMKLNRG